MRLTQQTIALAQTYLGVKVDGIDGEKTQAALPEGVTLEAYCQRVCDVDIDGDPRYEMLVDRRAEDDTVHGAPGVSGLFIPRGVMIHHTGFPGQRQRANPESFIKGRPDLRGPLCQVVVNVDGTAAWITNGRAQHAGAGWGGALLFPEEPREPGPDDTYGNSHFYGIEIDNSGREDDDYNKVQLDRAVEITAAVCKLWNWPAHHVIGHKEWTTRKVDPSFDMHIFRERVRRELQEKNPSRLVADLNRLNVNELFALHREISDALIRHVKNRG